MRNAVPRTLRMIFVAATMLGSANAIAAQPPAPPSPITRAELLKQVLPAGDYRNVQVAMVQLAPGAAAAAHRHDVAVVVYVVEGEVENRFDGGTSQVHKVGESWWEAPGTVHDVVRNLSLTTRARLLVVYIGEEGKATSTPVR